MTDPVAVIIPCLNEAASIASLVAKVRKFLPHVIVVDDGSTDDTGNLARAAGAEVLRHSEPRGKGAALSLGFKRAREKGFCWALAMDGDGQHAASDIPLFLAAMTNAPLIIGNRMSNPKSMPWLRRWVNLWMSRRLSELTRRNLPDTQCGFRLLRLDGWSELDLRASHFEIESEILLQFIAAAQEVRFVPIQVIYKNERSKIHPWRDTLRWLRWLKNAKRQFRDHPSQSDIGVEQERTESTERKTESRFF